MRKPTVTEVADFHKACAILDGLGKKGFNLYLAMDSMNLMIGDSHDDNGRPLEENSTATHHIERSGGGDW